MSLGAPDLGLVSCETDRIPRPPPDSVARTKEMFSQSTWRCAWAWSPFLQIRLSSRDSPTSLHTDSPRSPLGTVALGPERRGECGQPGQPSGCRACPGLSLPAGVAPGVGARQLQAPRSAIPGSPSGPCTTGPLWASRAHRAWEARPAAADPWVSLCLGVHLQKPNASLGHCPRLPPEVLLSG